MRLLPKRSSERAAEAAPSASNGVPQAGTETAAPAGPTSGDRGKLRKRRRELARDRQALLLQIGALVFETRRRGQQSELLEQRLGQLQAMQEEAAALDHALGTGSALGELVMTGIAGTCDRCGAVYGTEASFCSSCGTQVAKLTRRERRVVAAAAQPAAAQPAAAPVTDAAAAPASETAAATAPEEPAAAPDQQPAAPPAEDTPPAEAAAPEADTAPPETATPEAAEPAAEVAQEAETEAAGALEEVAEGELVEAPSVEEVAEGELVEAPPAEQPVEAVEQPTEAQPPAAVPEIRPLEVTPAKPKGKGFGTGGPQSPRDGD